MTTPEPSPYGCRHCGIDRPHGWTYRPDVGLHQYVPPTDAQILARMKARRAARRSRRWTEPRNTEQLIRCARERHARRHPLPTTTYRTPDGWVWVQQPDKPPHPRRYEWLLDPEGYAGWSFAAPTAYIVEHHGPMTPVRVVVADETGDAR